MNGMEQSTDKRVASTSQNVVIMNFFLVYFLDSGEFQSSRNLNYITQFDDLHTNISYRLFPLFSLQVKSYYSTLSSTLRWPVSSAVCQQFSGKRQKQKNRNGNLAKVSSVQTQDLVSDQCHQKPTWAAHWSGIKRIVQRTCATGMIPSTISQPVNYIVILLSTILYVDTECMDFNYSVIHMNSKIFQHTHTDYRDPKFEDNIDSNCGFDRPAGDNKYCRFRIDGLNNCSPSKTNHKYGFPEKRPCIFLKLNRVSMA